MTFSKRTFTCLIRCSSRRTFRIQRTQLWCRQWWKQGFIREINMDHRFQELLVDVSRTKWAQEVKNVKKKEAEEERSILKRLWNFWKFSSIQSRPLLLLMINFSTTTAFSPISWNKKMVTGSRAIWSRISYRTVKSSTWEEQFQPPTTSRGMPQPSSICNSLRLSLWKNHWIQLL